MQVKSGRGIRSRKPFQYAFKRRSVARPCKFLDRGGPETSRQAFLRLVRHELRTPLAGILGMVELLRSAPMAGEQRQLVAALEKSGRQMEALLERINSGNLAGAKVGDISLQHFNGLNFLEQVVRAHWPAARNQGLGLYLVLDARLVPGWWSDRVYLRQLLDNLLTNAIKFTHRGYVLIKAMPARGPDADKNDLELQIADTGIGIPSQVGERIYGVRERGSREPAQESVGTGLGLYVCKHITRALGAHLEHAPRLGGGTVFRLVLPGVIAPHPAPVRKLRPRLLRGLRCGLGLEEPVKSVLVNLLQRLGIQVAYMAAGRLPGPLQGIDAVICDPRHMDQNTLRRCGLSADSGPVVLSHRFSSGPARTGDGRERIVLPLPSPVLLSNLEPLMLRLALQGKLYASGGHGDSVE